MFKKVMVNNFAVGFIIIIPICLYWMNKTNNLQKENTQIKIELSKEKEVIQTLQYQIDSISSENSEFQIDLGRWDFVYDNLSTTAKKEVDNIQTHSE